MSLLGVAPGRRNGLAAKRPHRSGGTERNRHACWRVSTRTGGIVSHSPDARWPSHGGPPPALRNVLHDEERNLGTARANASVRLPKRP